MKLIAIQVNSVWEDKQATFRRVTALLRGREIQPGSLLVLPEMFSTGFSMNVVGIEEGTERLSERFLAGLAARYQSFVLGGVVTTAPDGRGRNQAVLYGPDGAEQLRYQKIYPFRYGGETEYYEPGTDVVTFGWNGFEAVPFICYDLRFPEVFRQAVRRGAELFIVIASWPETREEHWITLLRARAIENQAYVVGVNRCGRDPRLSYSGRSLIVDPRGRVLMDAGCEECILEAVLDREEMLAYRQAFPALADIRN